MNIIKAWAGYTENNKGIQKLSVFHDGQYPFDGYYILYKTRKEARKYYRAVKRVFVVDEKYLVSLKDPGYLI